MRLRVRFHLPLWLPPLRLPHLHFPQSICRAPQQTTFACKDTALAKAGHASKILGVDVSRHDTNIDWNKLVADGYYFVFLKATQGATFKDSKFREYWDAAGRAGLIRGAYHWLSNTDATSQVSNFLAVLQTVTLGPCDIGAALDLEEPFAGAGQLTTERVEVARAWLRGVRKAIGKPPILYVSARYLAKLGDPPDFAEYPLWIPSYSPQPRLPSSRTHYAFWQFSDGVLGPRLGPQLKMDMNMFNGSPAELFALAR